MLCREMAVWLHNFVRKRKNYADRDSKTEMYVLRARIHHRSGRFFIRDVPAMPEMRLSSYKKDWKNQIGHFLADMPPSGISCP